MSTWEAKEFLVSGVVQGVGYRAFAQRAAQPLQIFGSAVNLADGRVRVRVAGQVPALQQYQQLLQRGPSFAQVRAIEVQELALEQISERHTQSFSTG